MGIEFLEEMSRRANLYEISLTNTDRVFFKKLMDYMKEHGVKSETGYEIHLTLKQISTALDWKVRSVQHNMESLVQAHCITRISVGEKPRLKTKTIIEYIFYGESGEVEDESLQ